jgi:hypothetical protein
VSKDDSPNNPERQGFETNRKGELCPKIGLKKEFRQNLSDKPH